MKRLGIIVLIMLFIFVVLGLKNFLLFSNEKDTKDKGVEIKNVNQIDEYLKTVWLVNDYKEDEVYGNMSFIILEQDGDRIKGKFTVNDVLYPDNHLYFTGEGSEHEETYAGEFDGKLDGGKAVCSVTWDYYGIEGEMTLKFIDRKKIVAKILFEEEKCELGKLTSGEYVFTTLDLEYQNNSDFTYDDTIKGIQLAKWGNVKLVSRIRRGGKHTVLYLYLIDNFDNIIYDFSSEYPFPYMTKVNESKFEDINGDGLEDVIFLLNSIGEKDEGSDNQVRIYFQNRNGGFEESKQLFDIVNSLSKKRRRNISYILNYVKKQMKRLEVEVYTSSNCEIMIPNPENCIESIPKIQLYKKEGDIKENFEKRSEYDDSDKIPIVDLPYLGLNKPVYITNFAIGYMGKENAEEIDIIYKTSKKGKESKKTVKGNCLVLTLNTKESDDVAGKAYLAVLDYQNRKNYLVQTGLETLTLSKLNLSDFTGDGMDEIIVSGVANNWMEWQMFKLINNNITEIRSDFYKDDEYSSTNYIANAFESNVISTDKIKITCKSANFRKVISVSKFIDDRGLEDEDVDICGEAGEIYGYDYFENVDSKTGICINLDILLYNEQACGKIKVYLKYSSKKQKMYISNLEYRSVKE